MAAWADLHDTGGKKSQIDRQIRSLVFKAQSTAKVAKVISGKPQTIRCFFQVSPEDISLSQILLLIFFAPHHSVFVYVYFLVSERIIGLSASDE